MESTTFFMLSTYDNFYFVHLGNGLKDNTSTNWLGLLIGFHIFTVFLHFKII